MSAPEQDPEDSLDYLLPLAERIARGSRDPAAAARSGSRSVFFREAGKAVKTPTFIRDALKAGNRIAGPALIEEHASTTVVRPGDSLRVDELGDLVIAIGRK